MKRQESKDWIVSQAVSHANLIALVGNVWHLTMSAIFGQNCSGCFAKLTQNGSWQRMCQGYYQAKMEGFSDEFCETWPKWGVMRSGTVFQPMLPVQNFGVSESPLWPRPIASDSIAWLKCKKSNPRISVTKLWSRHGQDRPIYDFMWNGVSATQAAEYHEMMMGFPPHWTDLDASEMPSCRSSFTRYSG